MMSLWQMFAASFYGITEPKKLPQTLPSQSLTKDFTVGIIK